MVSRRGFLKFLGAGAATAVVAPQALAALAQSSAPLYIPAQNLDMGTPRRILTATELPTRPTTLSVQDALMSRSTDQVMRQMADSVPVTLLRDEYLQEWGGRMQAGSTILVDHETATRWLTNNIAVSASGPVSGTAGRGRKVMPMHDWAKKPTPEEAERIFLAAAYERYGMSPTGWID